MEVDLGPYTQLSTGVRQITEASNVGLVATAANWTRQAPWRGRGWSASTNGWSSSWCSQTYCLSRKTWKPGCLGETLWFFNTGDKFHHETGQVRPIYGLCLTFSVWFAPSGQDAFLHAFLLCLSLAIILCFGRMPVFRLPKPPPSGE